MNAPAMQRSHEGPTTWETFVMLGEDDLRELVDGDLLEIEVPTEVHEYIVALLVTWLNNWVRPRRAGRVYASSYKIKVGPKRGVMPDVQVYLRDNPAKATPQGVEEGRPDLAIEVVSPSSVGHDRVTKLTWYASIGVPEYWLIDPAHQTVERLVLKEGHYFIADALTGDAVLQPSSFPGLEIPLAELWETREPSGA